MQETKSEKFDNAPSKDISFYVDSTVVDLPKDSLAADAEDTVDTIKDEDQKNKSAAEPKKPEKLKQEKPTALPYRRRRSGLPMPVLVLIIVLIVLLIGSGTALILIAETTQYRSSLQQATTEASNATRGANQTSESQQTGTIVALSTAQANIEASATAQANKQDAATATVVQATATAQALSDFFEQSTNGSPIFSDSLEDEEGDGKWDQGSSGTSTGCAFEENMYHASEATNGKLQPCIAQGERFSSFAYQAYVTVEQGQQGRAGLLFRVSNDNKSYYFFSITAEGIYAFEHYNANQGRFIVQDNSSAINRGLNEENQLTVITSSNRIHLYANGEYLATVVDSRLSGGKIGVAVVGKNGAIDAAFRDAQVWELSSSSDDFDDNERTPAPRRSPTASPTARPTRTPSPTATS